MGRSRHTLYDRTLLAATLGLLFLYVVDPYKKLVRPSNTDPQLPDHDTQVMKQEQYPEDPLPANIPQILDYRPSECQRKIYTFDFMKVSIIIYAVNLHFLTATLTSVTAFTKWKYIQEVIVTDPGTMGPKDMARLEEMVKDLKYGRFIKNPDKGHVSARLLASKQAQGDVLIFLEASVIVTPGWIDPILDGLHKNPKSFVMPSFDEIKDSATFTYEKNSDIYVPYIDRDMSIKMKVAENKAEQIEVATIRREFFAVKTWFFKHIGMLDREVGDLGGVHQELSLRVWLCGGSIRMLTCSHVGLLNLLSPLVIHDPINVWRINEMWIKSKDWDPFYLSDKQPTVAEAQKKSVAQKMELIVKKLKCVNNPKTFIDKFLPKVSPFELKPSQEDLAFQKRHKAMVAKPGGRAGLMRSKSANKCLSPDEDRFLRLGPCNPETIGIPWEKMAFRLTHLSQIKVEERCVTVVKNHYLRVMDCDNANEKWNYREQQSFVWEESGQLLFWVSRDCIVHVPHPNPTKNKQPIPMKRNCDFNKNVTFSTWEILV